MLHPCDKYGFSVPVIFRNNATAPCSRPLPTVHIGKAKCTGNGRILVKTYHAVNNDKLTGSEIITWMEH